MSRQPSRKKEFRDLFFNEILTRPVIFDNDYDGVLCLAYINSKLKKEITLAGLKYRFRDRSVLKEESLRGSSCLAILSHTPWQECSYIDFEVHGCYSVGHHFLLKHEDCMISPNKEFEIEGEKSKIFVQKYPLSTIFYLIYLFDDYSDFTERQLKILAIPDKTFQNSWIDKLYDDPYPTYLYENGRLRTPKYACKRRYERDGRKRKCNKQSFFEPYEHENEGGYNYWICNHPDCGEVQRFPLRGYRDNFKQWEDWLNFEALTDILDDYEFYQNLFEEYPDQIFGKYPNIDMNLIDLILDELDWTLPEEYYQIISDEVQFKYLFLIPEYRKAPFMKRIPKDVFHHARLDIRNVTISRLGEIITRELC